MTGSMTLSNIVIVDQMPAGMSLSPNGPDGGIFGNAAAVGTDSADGCRGHHLRIKLLDRNTR
jgi:hypothetical protein